MNVRVVATRRPWFWLVLALISFTGLLGADPKKCGKILFRTSMKVKVVKCQYALKA